MCRRILLPPPVNRVWKFEMKPIKSLEEIRERGRKWAEAPTKTIRAISQKEILNLYTAANKFIPDRLRHYARLYGFPNYKRASVRCLHHAVGRCGNDNHIDIDFFVRVICRPYGFRYASVAWIVSYWISQLRWFFLDVAWQDIEKGVDYRAGWR